MADVASSNQKRAALRTLFSAATPKALFESLAYYVHEQVAWRRSIHLKGTARIHPTASIRNAHNVYVGENSHINHHCCVWAGDTSEVRLGDNLLMGPGVMMFAGNHGMALGTPMTFQPRTEKPISIGDDVWLGAGVVVTGGVSIADGVVVASGAVVTKSITEPNAIVGGIPARVLTYRK